jgi:signal transduction histidine kinase
MIRAATKARGWSRHALVLVALLAAGAQAAEYKRVLILHSFGRDFAPFNVVAPAIRSELARIMPQRIVFHDASLNVERPGPLEDGAAFVEFLRNRHGAAPPDLIVVLGAPALQFLLQHRARLFPDTPLVAAGIEQRLIPKAGFRARDAVLPVRLDIPRIVENILQVLPETTTVAVIMGASPFEQFWLKQMKSDLAPLAKRVNLLWLSALTLEQLRERVAALPPRSAVFYGIFAVGTDGVPHETEQALAAVRAASSAPVFGAFESQIGRGVVGGPVIVQREGAIRAAHLARRILNGDTPAGVVPPALELSQPVFDWRELRHWGIPVSRLPAGSEIRFRPPSLWQEHKALIITAIAIFLLQTALIGALLIQHRRRRRAEGHAASLTGRLLTAHEDERRRLARELHDDMTQRLARLAIDAGRIEQGKDTGSPAAAARSLREELVRLSEDVHALSYRLHPSVLDDLGLVEALRAECDRVSRREAIHVEADMRDVPPAMPQETALCLFRVAQEALRNVTRHARAGAVMVSLAPHEGGLRLAVSDNGKGFDVASHAAQPSLGHVSMRERVRQIGGELDIESAPGEGTTVAAWVPMERGIS